MQTLDGFRPRWLSKLPSPSPLIAAVLQSAIIACISNTVGQAIDAYNHDQTFASRFSIVTLLRFLALDLITAPPNYKWQEFLEYTFPARPTSSRSRRDYTEVPLEERRTNSKDDDDDDNDDNVSDDEESQRKRPLKAKLNWRNTFAKWFIDCITFGAIFNTLAFLIVMGILKGQSPSKIGQNIRHETLTIIFNGYKIWPVANFIAHTLVPWEKKIVWFSFVGLCWNVYLSLVAFRL